MVAHAKFRRFSPAGFVLGGAALVGLMAGSSTTRAARTDAWPARLQANYDISFNGIGVGAFKFESTNDGQAYNLTSDAKLSFLLGTFKWSGVTQAQGRVSQDGPVPQGFNFTYQSSKKNGNTRLGFSGTTVTSVLHDPPSPPKDGVVPVTAQHLKGVIDPMSAMLVVSKGTSGDPCTRRIPIYDGKERFDLVLSPRGQTRISEARPSGQPGVGYVCRVKYVPIAGHKPDKASSGLAAEDGIEIVLRPIPAANVFVPVSITIPTAAGSARITARNVTILTGGQEQIALSH